MTYLQFKNKWEVEILPNKEPNIRKGQSLMNFLFNVSAKEYKRMANTDIHCFYNDDLINNTLEHLEKVWGNYPN
jgi:hypothetical protein